MVFSPVNHFGLIALPWAQLVQAQSRTFQNQIRNKPLSRFKPKTFPMLPWSLMQQEKRRVHLFTAYLPRTTQLWATQGISIIHVVITQDKIPHPCSTLTLCRLEFNWEKAGLGAAVHVCKHTGRCAGARRRDSTIRDQAAGFEPTPGPAPLKISPGVTTPTQNELRMVNA